MSVPKTQTFLDQSHGVSRSIGVSFGTSEIGKDTELLPEEFERQLTRRLNRRGTKLRVKRRRGDTNITYAEKQLVEIDRRLAHVCDHVLGLQRERAEGQILLTLASSTVAKLSNQRGRS